MDNALGLFGLAKRAGRAEIGEKPAQSAAASKKARAIFTASDASENTLKRVRWMSQSTGIPHLQTPYSKNELGEALGRTSCAVVAVNDAGIAAGIAKKLAQQEPEAFGAAAQALSAKSARILNRRHLSKKNKSK